MISLSQISESVSNIITNELDYSQEQKEVVAYGIESMLLTVIGFVAILVLALILNVFVPAAIAAVFGGLLRKISGGAHFNTPLKCLTFGAVSYSLLGIVAKEILRHDVYSLHLSLILLGFSLIIVAVLAPVDCEAKPIFSQTLRKNLKIISIIFVIFTIIVVLLSHNPLLNISAGLGIGYHSMTLLPIFNKKRRREKL